MKTKKITPIIKSFYPVDQTQHEKDEVLRKKINEIIKEINK